MSNISHLHFNMLLVLGLVLFGGTIGGRLFQKIKIPQVVGYIFIGFLLGPGCLQIVHEPMIRSLQPFSYFALGLIGFMIGGELSRETLKKYGQQFVGILFFEGLFAFIFVTLLIGFVGSLFFPNAKMAWALALVLGAIASATAPAATTDVLWEHKAKGPLTTTIFGIVALDDVLAIVLFAIASSFATHLLGASQETIVSLIIHPVYEIVGALFVGGISGFILVVIIQHYQQKERMFVFLIGMVLFVLGFSATIGISMLLAAMTLGVVVVNGASSISKQVFSSIKDFSPPVFILFFVLVGSKLNLQSVNLMLFVFVVLYLIGRTFGKMIGAYWGASLSGADHTVKKYLPFCLFSQAGVAIGLSLAASQSLNEEIGSMIIALVTITTFVVQLVGPSCVKYAITKAQEDGKGITEDDIVCTTLVRQLMDPQYPAIREDTPISMLLDIFAKSLYTQYPVVDPQGRVSGVINIDGIKNSLLFERSDRLLLAADLKEPFPHAILKEASLREAKNYMDRFRLGFLPVTNKEGVVVGGFDRRMYQKFVSTKLLEC